MSGSKVSQVILIHTPKCAGTALRQALKRAGALDIRGERLPTSPLKHKLVDIYVESGFSPQLRPFKKEGPDPGAAWGLRALRADVRQHIGSAPLRTTPPPHDHWELHWRRHAVPSYWAFPWEGGKLNLGPFLGVVRNPFDRVHSVYSWLTTWDDVMDNFSFERFVLTFKYLWHEIDDCKQWVDALNLCKNNLRLTASPDAAPFHEVADIFITTKELIEPCFDLFTSCWHYFTTETVQTQWSGDGGVSWKQLSAITCETSPSHDEVHRVTDILRFESLNEDYAKFCDKYNIANKLGELTPKERNFNSAKKAVNKSTLYTPEMKEVIHSVFKEDLDRFGYSHESWLQDQ